MVLSVPTTGNRYYSVQFQDSYLNTFDYVGTRQGDTTAGQYFIYGPNYSGTIPTTGYVRAIQAPTDTVWLLARTFVRDSSDVAAANAVQAQYGLSYYNGQTPSNPFPPIATPLPSPGSPGQIPALGASFYTELNAGLANNPPPANPDQTALLDSFKAIGIGAGADPSNLPTPTEAQQAIVIGQGLIQAELLANQTNVNNWTIIYNAGNYGSNYLLRAAVAQFGIAAHVPEEALYFTSRRDVLGNPLTGANSYRISFAADNLPPVDPDGFWSLTLYNSAGFLVDNVINRYSLGSNTPLQFNADGSLDLYLGNTAPTSAKELANWLPTPKGEFNLALRTYLPSATLLNRAYQIPGIQAVPDVPEPSSLPGLLALGALGTGVTLKRKSA